MHKQIFYTYKFKSSRLKEFDFNIESLTFEDAKENREIISLFDNQLLRSIRTVNEISIDYDYINKLKKKIKYLKRVQGSKDVLKEIKQIQNEINKLLFVPEIISIVIENKSHYKYLFKHGLKLNGKTFRRFSSSAGQARASTVVFCEKEIADKLDIILNNGRDESKELVPSKFNAYKGLVTSSSSVVSTPRFCLVPDYISETDVKVNFVTETELNEDDIIDVRNIKEKFNRFDGQGIISVEMATKWSEELGLDYIPAQWCIRQNYIKGMLTTFDIKSFCDEVNNKNYMIRTSYKDENGNYKLADLRDTDVIITESQFKLWDSFSSLEEYKENCLNNDLQWGIALVSPKKDKDILKMNYQFLQTLRLSDRDIRKVSEKFVDWVSGVTTKDIYHTILFLLGANVSEDKIIKYMNSEDNHWVKALMYEHSLINDKYIKKKIYDLMKKKIRNGCLGQIIVDGNFQVLVSDPYAMMQHVCGLEVTGLLGKNEFYSNYWNKKGVKVVDSMRAPLTYRSEHVLLNLMKSQELDKWYKYNDTGIIVNVHGHETMNWAGSDFDMDIIATTSDEVIIKGVYKDELPITYTPPKSKPEKISDKKLYNADLHSFGSEIGQITNKSTSGYALLSELDEDSAEFNTTMNRIKMCTKLQSAQIDKAKIGRKVKSIPKIWVEYNRISANDSEEIKNKKEFLNNTLLNKHPYFFTYLYKNTRKKYKEFFNNQNATSQQRFGMTIDELKKLNRKTKNQIDFLNKFYNESPVIDSDCVMNKICRYIESIDFGIRNIVNKDGDKNLHKLLMFNSEIEIDGQKYKKAKKVIDNFKSLSNQEASANSINKSIKHDWDDDLGTVIQNNYDKLKSDLLSVFSNEVETVDYLVYMFYENKEESNKEILWTVYGDQLLENIKRKSEKLVVPLPNQDGEIEYLGEKFSLKEVVFENE